MTRLRRQYAELWAQFRAESNPRKRAAISRKAARIYKRMTGCRR